METLVLLFLLIYAGGDEEMRSRLKNLLDLYRENRALIQALTQNVAPMSDDRPSETPGEPAGSSMREDEKDRPRGETGTVQDVDIDVLRRYLGSLHQA